MPFQDLPSLPPKSKVFCNRCRRIVGCANSRCLNFLEGARRIQIAQCPRSKQSVLQNYPFVRQNSAIRGILLPEFRLLRLVHLISKRRAVPNSGVSHSVLEPEHHSPVFRL